MSTKIIGITVGTPTSPMAMAEKLKPVTSINGQTPDENGNVEIEVGAGSEQNVTLDTTLTQSGAAADAKATGDRITQVEGKIPTKPADIEADPAGAASEAIDNHNTDLAAHPYLLEEISEIEESLDKINTGKVNVADIVDNMTTEAADKPLSASMGFVLKNLLDLHETRYDERCNNLEAGKLDADALPEAVDDALAQAKASGLFDGADGSAATVAIVGATAIPAGSDPSVTEAGGSTAQNRKYILGIPNGPRGPAYELTDDDKAAITAAVVEALPKYAGEVSAT